MNNNNEIVGSTKGTSKLTRARFGPGMLLQHGDLEQLNNYTRDLSRLLFQSFFGCGVVCGLTVEGTEDCGRLKITVQPGVAITCAGDPVYVPPGIQPFWTRESFKPENAKDVWIKLCRKTKCCSPRTTTCSSDEDEVTSECTREKEGFEIHVVTDRPDCACACPPSTGNSQSNDYIINRDWAEQGYAVCHADHYEGKCGCTCGECSDCDCECILLAKLTRTGNPAKWLPDHGVRRFIRPMLIPDPALKMDKEMREEQEVESSTTEAGSSASVGTKAKGRKAPAKVNK